MAQKVYDLGPVCPIFKGNWSATAKYETLNMVRHGTALWVMIAKTYTVGSTPSESSAFWKKAAQDGATGARGATGATGPKGDTGPTGQRGLQGLKGDKGDKGDTGPQGPAGSTSYTAGALSGIERIFSSTHQIALPTGGTWGYIFYDPGSKYLSINIAAGGTLISTDSTSQFGTECLAFRKA